MKGEHFRNPRAELPDVCVGGIGNDYVIVSFHLHRQTHSLIHTHSLTHTLSYTREISKRVLLQSLFRFVPHSQQNRFRGNTRLKLSDRWNRRVARINPPQKPAMQEV